MQLRTELQPDKLLNLELGTNFYSIGSCFADAMGQKLQSHKFNILSNPFGVIYDPISIFNLLSADSIENTLVENSDMWYSYACHSDLRSNDQKELQEKLQSTKKLSTEQLNNCNVLIITFGTAFIYKLNETGEVVANCHKIPQQQFTKELLSVKQIISAFEQAHHYLTTNNQQLQTILTVSPVRHIKDSLELNAVSKANLRVACHELQKQHKSVHYFPAHELMIDDLRDYRFYKDDLLHPTPFAENYIWDKFTKSIFNQDSLSFISEWESIAKALEHKPFNPNSENHKSFLKKTLSRLQELNKQVDCSEEIQHIQYQLK